MAVWPTRSTSANRSPRRAAPSSMEYSVCTWRWTKSEPPADAMRAILRRPTDTLRRVVRRVCGRDHLHGIPVPDALVEVPLGPCDVAQPAVETERLLLRAQLDGHP